MFDITKAIETDRQFQIVRNAGYKLPYKKTDKGKRISNAQKKEIDDNIDKQANIESMAIDNGFKNKSIDFGLRLVKSHGERHRVGGYAI
jgi:hypothetical protein